MSPPSLWRIQMEDILLICSKTMEANGSDRSKPRGIGRHSFPAMRRIVIKVPPSLDFHRHLYDLYIFNFVILKTLSISGFLNFTSARELASDIFHVISWSPSSSSSLKFLDFINIIIFYWFISLVTVRSLTLTAPSPSVASATSSSKSLSSWRTARSLPPFLLLIISSIYNI